MNIENEVKILKDNNPKTIFLVKTGAFYHTYLKDTYIISYLFGYQLKKSQNLSTCGFPATIIDSVVSKLEKEKINYIISNSKLEIESKKDFEEYNKYDEVYNNSYKYLVKKSKIDTINRYLLENIYNEDIMDKISDIEKIIYKF
jgi:hypothetical protein